MKKLIIGLCLLCFVRNIHAQELFAYTEPASNMAKGSIGIRMNNYLMKEKFTNGYNHHLVPEVMFGVSKKIMIHADAFLSNRSNAGLTTEGGSVYAKYRFYSADDVQKHFRMALYGRYSFNNSDIHQEEINLYGHNSGYDVGLIATQLLHKVALSSSVSLEQALDNGNNNKLPNPRNSTAVNYTFSVGKLTLPKNYTTFNQTNLNLMLEILGQTNTGTGRSYLDAAPVVQFIFNSKARLDVGYRKELYSSLLRTAPNGFLLRLEYNFFNAF